jgi:hypothetical protein
MSDDDRDFRERFDTGAIYVVLALAGWVSGTWVRVTIRRLCVWGLSDLAAYLHADRYG